MKRILFATDFSALSENAFAYALELFKKEFCSYTILHVIPFTYQSDELYDYSPMLDTGPAEAAMNELMQKFAPYAKKKEISIETKIEFGDPALQISEYADRMEMDLILMGTKGKGAGDFFVGSTTFGVVKRSHCPMLIIPGESRFKKPKKMLFAIDLKKSIKEKSLMPLLVIAKKYHTEVLLLQVKSEEEESLNEAVLGLRINSSLEGLAHSYHVIYENDIAGGIERFALDNGADLLVMISKQQHLFERIFHKSIRKKMLLHSSLPILLLDNN